VSLLISRGITPPIVSSPAVWFRVAPQDDPTASQTTIWPPALATATPKAIAGFYVATPQALDDYRTPWFARLQPKPHGPTLGYLLAAPQADPTYLGGLVWVSAWSASAAPTPARPFWNASPAQIDFTPQPLYARPEPGPQGPILRFVGVQPQNDPTQLAPLVWWTTQGVLAPSATPQRFLGAAPQQTDLGQQPTFFSSPGTPAVLVSGAVPRFMSAPAQTDLTIGYSTMWTPSIYTTVVVVTTIPRQINLSLSLGRLGGNTY